MRTIVTSAIVAAILAYASAMLAAPQQVTARPGDMTQARVWIENRGRSQAIPIDLQLVNTDGPLRVQVMNGEASLGSNPLAVRVVRSMWEYQTIVVHSPDEAAKTLAPLGSAGWEAAGATWAIGDGATALLLKRAR